MRQQSIKSAVNLKINKFKRMTQISAQIVADSKGPNGDRLTTMLITFPRFILAELNTHRMLSKNSASSRAIPFNKMVESVQNNPFIPIAWQKDHKGMQGTEYLTGLDAIKNDAAWLRARDYAVEQAKELNELGVTKQLCNRLLEPFMWHTVLISGTEFSNFFNLRCPQYSFDNVNFFRSKKDACLHIYNGKLEPDNKEDIISDLDWFKINKGQAEIHMMALAEAIYDAMNESTPKQLKAGEWHIPFSNDISANKLFKITGRPKSELLDADLTELAVKVATARCARVSYTVVGEEGKEPNYVNDIKLHDILLKNGHASPLEHIAQCMNKDEYNSRLYKKQGESGWSRNFRGFKQYREVINL